MPRQVLFIQGGGEDVHDTWDNKLVDSLQRELGEEYAIRYPRMPKEDEPDYSTWKDAILAEVGDLDAGAILVGHSIGGTILIYALAEANPKRTPDAVFLVAPAFFGDGGWPGGEAELRADLADRLPKGMPVYLYHGTKDNDVPFEHMDLYAKAVPQATSRSLAGRDHQLNNDLSDVARDIRNEL